MSNDEFGMKDKRPIKRRWFRFSLRTLFVVVTVVCIWLGWNWRTVRSRQEILEAPEGRNMVAQGASLWGTE